MPDKPSAPSAAPDRPRDFWTGYQPGFRFADAPVGSREFFAQVEAHRYQLEPHIKELVGFERFRDQDVLEAGCGIGTDAMQFIRAGARYTGIDFSPAAIRLAQQRLELEGRDGTFVSGDITELPFADESFDLVYSNGVIHHVADTASAVDELHRVLRPGGRALVMVYHRSSLNYYGTIMLVRRVLAPILLLPGGIALVSRITGEPREVLVGHADLLRSSRGRYLLDKAQFLSNNTDGPGNPLSKVYTAREAAALFAPFDSVRTTVRYLNARTYPGGLRLSASPLGERLARRWGWHLWISAER